MIETRINILHTNAGKIKYVKAASVVVSMYLARGIDKTLPWLGKTISSSLISAFNTESWGDAWYGIDKQCGHVDYYANNVRIQPGCGEAAHFFDHSRAHELYNGILRPELELRSANNLAINNNNNNNYDATMLRNKQFLQQVNKRRLLAFNSSQQQDVSCFDEDGAVKKANCAIQIDFVTPVKAFIEESSDDYAIDLSPNEPRHNSRQLRYYFKTSAQAPFVGDQFVVRVKIAWTQLSRNTLCSVRIDSASGISEMFELNNNNMTKHTNSLSLIWTNQLNISTNYATSYQSIKDDYSLTNLLPTKLE